MLVNTFSMALILVIVQVAIAIPAAYAFVVSEFRGFLSAEGNNWGATMAAAGLATIPVLLVYVLLQRYVVDAFVRSGMK